MLSADDLAIDQLEEKANTGITDLIAAIESMARSRNPLIKAILSPKLLVRGLNELKEMVEMVDVKNSIVSQIKLLIVNQARRKASKNGTSNFEGQMLHTVISGNPGTGKTTVGRILGKIWMSLGFAKNKANVPKKSKRALEEEELTTTALIKNTMERLIVLEQHNEKNNQKIIRVHRLLRDTRGSSRDVRKYITTLRKDRDLERDRKKDWTGLLKKMDYIDKDLDSAINSVDDINVCTAEDILLSDYGHAPANNSNESASEDPYEFDNPVFVVASRDTLIAEYLGQTAIKTKKVLEQARGGVLFIDEAYSLCNISPGDSKDKYGEECLTTINEFMSNYPEEIIVIFAGYKEKLMQSVFRAQPGLLRRFSYFFEIKNYTTRGLCKIFRKQMMKNDWQLDSSVDLEKLLLKYKSAIVDNAGGTEQLSYFVKIEYAESKFLESLIKGENTVLDSDITQAMVIRALIKMTAQHEDREIAQSSPPAMMYT